MMITGNIVKAFIGNNALKNQVLFYYHFAPLIALGYCVDWYMPDKTSPPQKIIHVYFPFVIFSWWITDVPRGVAKRILTTK